MATIGVSKTYTVTMTTGSTLTSALDLGGSYGKLLLGIPTMTSGCNHYVHVGDSESGTFRRLYYPGYVDTGDPAVVDIDSSVTNCYVPIEAHAQYVKLEVSTAASDTSHTYKIIGSTN